MDAKVRAQALRNAGMLVQRRLGRSAAHLVFMPEGMPVANGLEILKALPGVLDAHPNRAHRALLSPNDPQLGGQWYLNNVAALAAWSYETGNTNPVSIAIIDSGIQADHPDLAAKIDASHSQDCSSGVCVGENPPVPACYHGTAVAGVAAASTNNGIGVAGISWGAKVVSLKVFPSDGSCDSSCGGSACVASDASVIAALGYAETLTGRVVANLSLGAAGPCGAPLQNALNAASAAGMTVVASAGNDGNAVNNPANCANVIPVGATDISNAVAAYSSRGPELAANGLVAPGGDAVNGILTTGLNGGYVSVAGTSYASSLVAGIAALMLSAMPTLTPAQVQTNLRSSAYAIGASAAAGAGLANAYRALRLTLSGVLPPDLSAIAPSYPPNYAYLNVQPNFNWIGLSTVSAAGLPGGALYLLQVSNNDPAFAPSSIVISIATPVVVAAGLPTADGAYGSTFTLTDNTTYYWRVAVADAQSEVLGPWLIQTGMGFFPARFQTDFTAPAQAAGFGTRVSTYPPAGEAQLQSLAANVTAQIGVQDAGTGLAVFPSPPTMDGHDYSSWSSPFGVLYSTNAGRTWIDSPSPNIVFAGSSTTHVLALAAFNNKAYAGTTNNAGLYVSASGGSWTQVFSSTFPGGAGETQIQSFAPFNGKLYFGTYGKGKIFSSPDGSTWTAVFTSPVQAGAQGIESMVVFNGKLFAVNSVTSVIYVSGDGASWSPVGSPGPSVNTLGVFNGRLYAGANGVLFVSADGVNWGQTSIPGTTAIRSLASYNGRLFAGTEPSGAVYGSANGVDWTPALTGTGGASIRSLAVFNGKLYAGTYMGGIYASPDGATWMPVFSSAAAGGVEGLAALNGKLYAGTDGGKIYQFTPVQAGLTGTNGATGAQTLSAFNLSLVNSSNSVVCGGVSPCGATNQVLFTASDLGGNVLTAGPFAVLISSMPSAPLSFARRATGVDSIQWSWTGASPNPSGYRVMAASANVSGDLPPDATGWLQTGLSTNTRYGPYVVRVFTSSGTADSASVSGYTLAAVPAGFAGSVAGASSATLSWSANGDPAGTVWDLERSSDGINVNSIFQSSAAASYTDYGLLPASTYFYQVRAKNGDGFFTAFAATATVITLPALSTAVPTFPVDGSYVNIQPNFDWIGLSTTSAAALPAGSAYYLQVSNNDPAFTPSNIVISISTPAVLTSTSVRTADAAYLSTFTLTDNTTYYWRVAANNGAFGAWSQASKFYADFTPPVQSAAFASLSGTSTLVGEAQINPGFGGAARLGVQDAGTGLAVTQGRLAFAGDGHDGPGSSGGCGVLYSTDAGKSWVDSYYMTPTFSSTAAVSVPALASFNGRLYAATANNAGLYASANGVTWNLVFSSTFPGGAGETQIQSFAVFNGKLFFGTYGAGKIFSSFNGTTWSAAYTAPAQAGPQGIASLTVFGGRIYASNSAASMLYASSDGAGWSRVPAPGPSIGTLGAFNGRLFAGGAGILFASVDGVNWSQASLPGATAIRTLAAFNGKFYAGTEPAGAVYASANGSDWAAVLTGTGETAIRSLAVFNGKLYAGAGPDGAIYASPDGARWMLVFSTAAAGGIASLAGFSGNFYAGTNDGRIILKNPLFPNLGGADGTTAAQTLSVFGLALNNSSNTVTCGGASPCAATNQVIFTVSDLAGNVLAAGPYAIVVSSPPPAAANYMHSAVGVDAIQWSWVSTATMISGFRVMSGTTNISGDLPPGTTVWLELGLATNTRYGPYFVRIFNSTGAADSWSASAFTLAAVPANLAATAVGPSSATVSWDANGNPSGTFWDLERSTDGVLYAPVFQSSVAASVADGGLTLSATYYYKVRAKNGDGYFTAFAGPVPVNVSGWNLAAPTAPGLFAHAAAGPDAIRWSWVNSVPNAAGLRVMSGSTSISGDLPAGTTSWLQTGLSINTRYGPYFARAFNSSGTADSSSNSGFTLAAAPAQFSISPLGAGGATLSWSPNGNPPNTIWDLERSTGTTLAAVFQSSAAPTFTDALLPGITYTYWVRAKNGEGIATDFAGPVSLALTPVSLLPTYPANGAYVNLQPNFDWIGASTAVVAGMSSGASYLLQVSNNDPGFSPASIVIGISTPAVVASTGLPTADAAYLSTFTLTEAATYYWRVALSGDSVGPWSPTFSFVTDFTPPAQAGAFASLNSSGAAVSESQVNDLRSTVTVQIGVQDAVSGLAVSANALALVGDGHDTPGFVQGFGVMCSSSAGSAWQDFANMDWPYWNSGVQSLASYNGKIFAGSANSGAVYSSSDGLAWSTEFVTSGRSVRSFAAFNGRLYAGTVAGAAVYSTGGGGAWTRNYAVAGDGVASITALASFNGRLYAASTGAVPSALYSSPDGINWYQNPAPGPPILSLISFNGQLYAGGSGGIYASADGVSWTHPAVNGNVYSLAIFGARLYAGTDYHGQIASSADGLNWTAGSTVEGTITALSAFNGKLYAANSNGPLFTTPDGVNWLVVNWPWSPRSLVSLAAFNGKLYIGSWTNGGIARAAPLASALSGADGTTAAQTLTGALLNLSNSAASMVCNGISPCGATNQAIFTAWDRAGNVRTAGPFAIQAAGPPIASWLSGRAMGTGSMLWFWPAPASLVVGYRVMSGTVNLSGDLPASATSWLEVGLSTNTTYYRFLRTFNSTGTADSYQFPGATSAAPPTSLAISPVGPSSATLSWSANGNPAGTTWDIFRSTDGVSYAWRSLLTTGATSFTDTSLAPLSTYYFKVAGRNRDSIDSALAGPVALPPLIAPPSIFAGTPVSTRSIFWSWNDKSVLGTRYRVISGNANVSGDLAGNTTTFLQTGLTPNTLYGPYWVTAFNGATNATSAPASRYTLAAAPSGLAAVAASSSAVGLSWSANGNPVTTLFDLQRSTSGTFVSIALTTAATFLDTGLNPSTMYWYQVRAKNAEGLFTDFGVMASTLTAAQGPPVAPKGFAGKGVATTRIAWSWSSGATNALGYRVMAGATNLSGNLFPDATSWMQDGLSTATCYGPYLLQAFNGSGVSTSSSAASACTLAAPPTMFYPLAVSTTSVTLSWSTNGNPQGTRYTVSASTAGSPFLSQTTATATVTFGGLLPATTYLFSIVAISPSSDTSQQTVTSARTADASAPAAATGFAGVALGTSAVQWRWTVNSAVAAGYRVLAGTANISGDLPPSLNSWTQTGLSPNRIYGPCLVEAFNSGGTADSGLASRATLAASPAGFAAVRISSTSATFSWSAAGNPSGTPYRLERSTTGATANFSPWITTLDTAATDGYLSPATTFYYRLAAVNADGVLSAYTPAAAVVTPSADAPPAPTNVSGAAVARNAIRWTWTGNSMNETGYRVLSAGVNLSGDLPPFTVVWLQTGLSTNTQYGPMTVQVFNHGGASVSLPPVSAYTLAVAPAGLVVSAASTTASLRWSANSNPAGTLYEVDRSTGGVFLFVANVRSTTYLDTGLSPLVAYSYQVRALNGDGVPTAFVRSGMTMTSSPGPPAAPR
ncbi:MAG: fibronectin type III domain-containing protein [Elusimicrobia bacterium]|nr:fibronectin type III domain-containing protein [Elusimicrobiota bacterium]